MAHLPTAPPIRPQGRVVPVAERSRSADSATDALDQTLLDVIARNTGRSCPPRLAAALHYAVFPGGNRMRPRLLLAVAAACGLRSDAFALHLGAALELVHCAALVHDDMPCFDDAGSRRGKPSVHRAFGEATALLVGDALIFSAFEAMSAVLTERPAHLAMQAMRELVHAGGSHRGLVAGQAWELEPGSSEGGAPVSDMRDVERYHDQKTGALFEAACVLGALAAGGDAAQFRVLGTRIGSLYQSLDDVLDVVAEPADLGKPVGQDAARGRPSVMASYGAQEAVRRLDGQLAAVTAAIPAVENSQILHVMVERSLAPYLQLVREHVERG
jgi:geranylgeranyl diphosphate synthase, type II